MLKEFKKFVSRGNVLDMAVGIIMGSAFTAIVTSLVNDILTPLIGLIIGGIDFSSLSITIGSASIAYGSFIQAIINFLLVALSLFLIVKGINKFHFKKEEKPAHQQQRNAHCASQPSISRQQNVLAAQVTSKTLSNVITIVIY